ncbi:hypothetical protein ACEQ8H_006177 [Pleosporales sp. CAS-2024a]
MPIDRNPQKPKLASQRTVKTPLTPRLAPGLAVTPSPATTNSAQPIRAVRSSNAATPRINGTVIDDMTPVKAFLSSNITPRSSSRKSRAGGESTWTSPSGTPINTPTSSRPTSTIDFSTKDHGIAYSGLAAAGNKGSQAGTRPRSTPGPSVAHLAPHVKPPLSSKHNSVPGDARSRRSTSPLFFHASDARPPAPPPPQKKAPVFFHANGQQDEPPQRPHASPPMLSAMGKPQAESKFFHADTISEVRSNPPNLIPSPMSVSPEPPAPGQGSSPSPTKEWAHLSYRKGASQIIRPPIASRNSALSILSAPTTPDMPDRPSRRSSAASYAMRGSHSKSASLSSIDSVTDPKHTPSAEAPIHAPSPLHTEKRVVSTASLPDSITSMPSPPLASLSGLPSPTSTSPTKPNSTQSALEVMNELAANARRERKVLDLEISNSSLLAINRSLEKEVRKQKAEIRRFRRMSRAGRFSVDDDGAALDNSPLLHGPSHLGDLSDMSEAGEEDKMEKPEEDEPISSDDSLDENQLSPSAQLERDQVHRFQDEKRLQLDLSKHRDLLLDSQRMNQSLKRCMNWTEQLIKDGQKALEYQVRPSDVKMGGRVLVAEDDDEHDNAQAEESKGLLSPWSPLHRSVDGIEALDSPFFAGAIERIVDRDSGVDVDGLDNRSMGSLGSPFEERIQRLQASIEALS